jgi:hypothetical protein
MGWVQGNCSPDSKPLAATHMLASSSKTETISVLHPGVQRRLSKCWCALQCTVPQISNHIWLRQVHLKPAWHCMPISGNNCAPHLLRHLVQGLAQLHQHAHQAHNLQPHTVSTAVRYSHHGRQCHETAAQPGCKSLAAKAWLQKPGCESMMLRMVANDYCTSTVQPFCEAQATQV